MEEKIKMIDESGDRKYFTQIPNIVVNHSTAYEQSLYLIMKRIAGENGTCFKSLNNLAKMMGIHRNTLTKTIKELLEREWIKEIEPVKIRGGKVRQFMVVDIWVKNIKEYESIESASQMPTSESASQNDTGVPKVRPKTTRGASQMDTKKNPEEELIKEELLSDKPTERIKIFSYKEELDKLTSNPRRDLQVIALYWKYKDWTFENAEQFQSALKRDLRPAGQLKGYSNQEIIEVIDWLCEKVEFKWTLETVNKYINEDLSLIKINKKYAK
jgi:DNA-binding Lrp family transcriptional regulator